MTRARLPVHAAVLVIAFVASCGNEEPDDICDGTAQVRFAHRVMDPEERVTLGYQVLFENGSTYLYVDGECRYFVHSFPSESNSDRSWRVWDPARTGVLTEPEAEELARSVRYGLWDSVDGHVFIGPGFDYPAWEFSDGASSFACVADCSDVSEKAWDIREAAAEWKQRLARGGEPMDGPMRGLAVLVPEDIVALNPLIVHERVETSVLFEHPFPYERLEHLGYGEAILIPQEEATMWRELRTSFLSMPRELWYYNYLPVEDVDGKHYRVYVRDTMPYEDESGIIQFEQVRVPQ